MLFRSGRTGRSGGACDHGAQGRRLESECFRSDAPAVGAGRFKQKTAYEISSGDWSSDVCSSDLSVKRPTSAQVMISWSVSSSPTSGSVLTAQSLEPVSDSVSPSL